MSPYKWGGLRNYSHMIFAKFSLNRPHLADSVIESPCPSVWMSVCLPQPNIFFHQKLFPEKEPFSTNKNLSTQKKVPQKKKIQKFFCHKKKLHTKKVVSKRTYFTKKLFTPRNFFTKNYKKAKDFFFLLCFSFSLNNCGNCFFSINKKKSLYRKTLLINVSFTKQRSIFFSKNKNSSNKTFFHQFFSSPKAFFYDFFLFHLFFLF